VVLVGRKKKPSLHDTFSSQNKTASFVFSYLKKCNLAHAVVTETDFGQPHYQQSKVPAFISSGTLGQTLVRNQTLPTKNHFRNRAAYLKHPKKCIALKANTLCVTYFG
jgi:hypothetical protein